MKALFLGLLALALWAAVLEGGLRQWEADDSASVAVGACLAAGGTVSDCGGVR